MGDGIVRRFAIIINGDGDSATADVHRQNVERAIAALNSDDPSQDYRIYVASAQQTRPAGVDYFCSPTEDNIEDMISVLHNGRYDDGEMDNDDELVIYVTGHGGQEGDQGRVDLLGNLNTDRLTRLLDIQGYGYRTVIMDTCYGGNWLPVFLNDPKTLFVSAGQRGDTVCCGDFAPHFWSDRVTDLNRDGVIAWWERFAYVRRAGGDISASQFLSSIGYVGPGNPPFEAGVVEIREDATRPESERQQQMETELDARLSALQPGQYAIIDFSAQGCEPCHDYNQTFEQLAQLGKGQYLFIRYESWEQPSRFTPYVERTRPQVILVTRVADGQEIIYRFADRDHIFEEITQYHLTNEQRYALAVAGLNSSDAEIRGQNLRQLHYLIEREDFELPSDTAGLVRRIIDNSSEMPENRSYAIEVYGELIEGFEAEQRRDAIRYLINLARTERDFLDVRTSALQVVDIQIGNYRNVERSDDPLPFNSDEEYLSFMQYLRGNFLHENDEYASVSIAAYQACRELLDTRLYEELHLQSAVIISELSAALDILTQIIADTHQDGNKIAAAIFAYASLVDGISVFRRYITRTLPILERLIDHPNAMVRMAVDFAYPRSVRELEPISIAPYARRIRNGFNESGSVEILLTRLSIYGQLFQTGEVRLLDYLEVNESAPQIRELIRHENRDVREVAVMAYSNIADGILNREEARTGMVALLSVLQNGRGRWSYNAMEHAVRGVITLARRLDDGWGMVQAFGHTVGLMGRDDVPDYVFDDLMSNLGEVMLAGVYRYTSFSNLLLPISRRALQILSGRHDRTYEQFMTYYPWFLFNSGASAPPEQVVEAVREIWNMLVLYDIHSYSEGTMIQILSAGVSLIERFSSYEGMERERDGILLRLEILMDDIHVDSGRVRQSIASAYARLVIRLSDDDLHTRLQNLQHLASRQVDPSRTAELTLELLRQADRERVERLLR